MTYQQNNNDGLPITLSEKEFKVDMFFHHTIDNVTFLTPSALFKFRACMAFFFTMEVMSPFYVKSFTGKPNGYKDITIT